MLSGRPFLVVFSPETGTEVETLMMEIEATTLDEISPLHRLLDLIAAPIVMPQVTGGKWVTHSTRKGCQHLPVFYQSLLDFVIFLPCFNMVGPLPASNFFFLPSNTVCFWEDLQCSTLCKLSMRLLLRHPLQILDNCCTNATSSYPLSFFVLFSFSLLHISSIFHFSLCFSLPAFLDRECPLLQLCVIFSVKKWKNKTCIVCCSFHCGTLDDEHFADFIFPIPLLLISFKVTDHNNMRVPC